MNNPESLPLSSRLSIILIAATAGLLVPLVAMRFTDEVDWTLGDFMIGAALLLGTGLTTEFVLREVQSKRSRFALVVGGLVVLLSVWAELAVGVFGTPFAGS